MLASAAFFVVKAMVSPPAGASPATTARVPAGPADDDSRPGVIRAHGSPSVLKRVLALVHHGTGGEAGTVGRGSRRLGRPARAD